MPGAPSSFLLLVISKDPFFEMHIAMDGVWRTVTSLFSDTEATSLG